MVCIVELIESAMYLYRATKDPYLLDIGVDILESIEYTTKTDCGYATVSQHLAVVILSKELFIFKVTIGIPSFEDLV